jgi:hypothetical protein
MGRKVFNNDPLPTVIQQREDQAVRAVAELDRGAFTQPTLAGVLEKIVAQHALDIATVRAATAGKPSGEGFIAVAFPFRGDLNSFWMIPSRSTVPPWECDIGDYQLIARIRHDETTQQRVDAFFREVNDNLNLLRTEAAAGRDKIAQAVKQAAENRRKAIGEEDKHDKGLGFPVTRS